MRSRSFSILALNEDDLVFAADEGLSDASPPTGGSGLPADADEPDPVDLSDPDPDPPTPEAQPVSEDQPPAPPDPAPELPPVQTPNPGPDTIDFGQILIDRPDVLKGFYEAYYGDGNDRNSAAWADRVGAATPEAYAKFWYFAHGRWEGYAQGETTAQDTVSAERILAERPDVLRAYYEAYYAHNDRSSDAWIKRVGGETAEDYARYWYDKYGRWEGYSQSDKAAAEAIDVKRLLAERPDVFRAYYEEFYGENNDRKSHAWIDRVGGDTVEDYAKYWYVTHGQKQGYTQRPGGESPGAPSDPGGGPSDPGPPVHDPADDPWNHPVLFPDWTPPYEGWQPPPDIWHGSAGETETPAPDAEDEAPPEPAPASASSLFDPDPFA